MESKPTASARRQNLVAAGIALCLFLLVSYATMRTSQQLFEEPSEPLHAQLR